MFLTQSQYDTTKKVQACPFCLSFSPWRCRGKAQSRVCLLTSSCWWDGLSLWHKVELWHCDFLKRDAWRDQAVGAAAKCTLWGNLSQEGSCSSTETAQYAGQAYAPDLGLTKCWGWITGSRPCWGYCFSASFSLLLMEEINNKIKRAFLANESIIQCLVLQFIHCSSLSHLLWLQGPAKKLLRIGLRDCLA